MARPLLIVSGLMALALALSRQVIAAGGARLTIAQVRSLAEKWGRRFGVAPLMLQAMVEIESAREPAAFRSEAHITAPDGSQGDASVGLMQTLWSTAHWLAKDMGYRAKGIPQLSDLLDPDTSMYFGAAYVQWLGRYHQQRFGRPATEQWIVMSYNGGPGADNPQTQNHWRKYQAARQRLIDAGEAAGVLVASAPANPTETFGGGDF